MSALLEVRGLTRRFGGGRSILGTRKPELTAVRGIDFDLHRGDTLGIVGESGCGKSTLARMLVGLDAPSEGSIALDGRALTQGGARALAKRVQYVFQDPVSSLNPRHRIDTILEAPMKYLLGLGKQARKQKLEKLCEAVGLDMRVLERYPHEFSGGQAQRIGIARALAAEPDIIVLDEPVSALDVSVQAQVLNLLGTLKRERDLTYIFISHDLAVVESVATRLAVMYFGRVVEEAADRSAFRAPLHPYTDLLLRSAPVPGQKRVSAGGDTGELPDPYRPPDGCAFAERCPRATAECRAHDPELNVKGRRPEHRAACLYPLDLPDRSPLNPSPRRDR
ncbi:oligopeptide/dipeptide ABC transporter ATP-binding protein [Fulvimarina sp. 2208YS6-2-32]|uniref:Oligopeptide/dipeptide ABC transporter ATP-binding protein n=1 Tax=Fulvimarina uroteuthidis TaxID=3098149 RepID=A0ABU5I612_9HYPH|nr:oligopeptide/dipeptide ABC transporter ATP-binding protein [Fulvimarina sp. 2208YS6-2-32]MDY8110560.1 oligopeptide/dipeptide ABC transporter ATP-binding protein [Fulvimarina sp. 2208YS6-2-32]